MAITRAQQARQMYKEGSKEPVEQAGVMNYMPSEMVTVPKIAKSSPNTPTAKLAYITPEEQDILIDLNLYGSLNGKPNRGPGGIPSLEGDFGSPTGQASTGAGTGGTYSGGGGGSRSDNDVSGRRDTGTGDYRDSNRPDDVAARKEYEVNRKKREADEIAKENKRIAEEAMKTFNQREIERKALERRKKMGAKLIKERIPGTQEYLDAEDDDTEAMLDLFINDPYREDGTKRPFLPTPMNIGLNLLEEPLKAGAKKTREFFSGPTTDIFGRKQKGVLAAGKFNYKGEPLTEERFANMSLTEKNQAYKDYMSQRLGNEIDAYGNPLNRGDDRGPDQPVIPIIPEPVDPGEGDDEETSPGGGRDMGGLAPRFAGSIFDFTGLADGGRVPAMGGGIMNNDIIGGFADGSIDEMGRQMYGLGKLVKKATRGIKKIAKSPIGKLALGAAAFKFGPQFLSGKGFGLGSIKSFKDLEFFGDAANVNMGRLIGLTSLAPMLFQQDDEEEYDSYRGPSIDIANIRNNPYNFLAPRFQGTRFAADGGIMRTGYQEGGDAEPVAKKTMPLIDMDGKEKDYRETGGFVDMGRMERADDVKPINLPIFTFAASPKNSKS